jgi:hypothetical protein
MVSWMQQQKYTFEQTNEERQTFEAGMGRPGFFSRMFSMIDAMVELELLLHTKS